MMTGVKGTLLDLFTRDQYMRFHGKEPPRDWREATPEDIRRAAGNEFPMRCSSARHARVPLALSPSL